MRGRLCIVCSQPPTDMGGIPTIVRDLARLYSSSGYDVHICTPINVQPVAGCTHVHSYPVLRRLFAESLWPFNLLWVCFLTVYLCYLQRRFRFSAFLPQDNYLQGISAVLAGRLTGCPSVVMDHGVATNIADPRWQRAWKERHSRMSAFVLSPLFRAAVAMQALVFRLVCSLADRFFYTGYELDEFYEQYGVDEAKRQKYDHLIDEDFFAPARDQSEVAAIRDRFGIPRDHFVLSCTSRINFEKGYPQIVAAFDALVRAVGRNVTLAIAGDTGQVHQTRNRAEHEKQVLLDYLASHDLTANTRFLGVLDPEGVRDLARASDVHVYAGTMSCSFSLCVLEAMACALPCIVTPVPRKQGDVITPDIGWVVPAGDSESLGLAFIDAYRRRGELKHMGLKARAYVLMHNTYTAMRKTYEAAVSFVSSRSFTSPTGHALEPTELT